MCACVNTRPVLVQNTRVRESLIKLATVEGIDVYHFLSHIICQCVSIVEVVNIYQFNVITICEIHLILNIVLCVLERFSSTLVN